MKINANYDHLNASYLFVEVAKRIRRHEAAHPDREIIRLGIGDVTRPLAPAVVEALARAAEEMGRAETFRGYGEEQGYGFLRRAVADYYEQKAVQLAEDEIFISDGAKSDLGNILDIFDAGNTVLLPDPGYPVYADTNIMAGRRILKAVGNIENNFLPWPDQDIEADIIYLCSPANPTGAVYDRAGLKAWVDHALKIGAVILFDAAYEAFIQDESRPASIYQIEGAKECAIEFGSFSKTAGFTGLRCGHTVVPRELRRGGRSLNKMWLRRQSAKFNGVAYMVQRGAEAALSPAGLAQARESIGYYLENAALTAAALRSAGAWFTGGLNSPYLWFQVPGQYSSWEFFDYLLAELDIAATPGLGFGSAGEGFCRLSAFGDRGKLLTALARLQGRPMAGDAF